MATGPAAPEPALLRCTSLPLSARSYLHAERDREYPSGQEAFPGIGTRLIVWSTVQVRNLKAQHPLKLVARTPLRHCRYRLRRLPLCVSRMRLLEGTDQNKP